MQELESLMKNKLLTKMDGFIYFWLERKPNRTMKEISSFGFAIDKVSKSLKRLEHFNLICKTEEKPARYFIK